MYEHLWGKYLVDNHLKKFLVPTKHEIHVINTLSLNATFYITNYLLYHNGKVCFPNLLKKMYQISRLFVFSWLHLALDWENSIPSIFNLHCNLYTLDLSWFGSMTQSICVALDEFIHLSSLHFALHCEDLFLFILNLHTIYMRFIWYHMIFQVGWFGMRCSSL